MVPIILEPMFSELLKKTKTKQNKNTSPSVTASRMKEWKLECNLVMDQFNSKIKINFVLASLECIHVLLENLRSILMMT